MTAIASMVAGFVILLLMWRNQRPAFLAALLVIYSLAYRIIDVGYLDLAGPVYAIELDRHVGGNGASPMFLYSCLCFILPLWFFVSRKRLMKGIHAPLAHMQYHVFLSRLAMGVASAGIAFLYFDMLRIGTIPLFSGMDRQAYNDISGLLHERAYEVNFLLCTSLGIFTVLPRLRGGRYSLAFAGLLVAVLVYWALTGNRASAFLISLSFYALPFGAVISMDKAGLLPRQAPGDAWASLVSAKVLLPIGIVLGVLAIGGLLFNSYYTVRNYADPMYQISQRVMVQPVQTWASTWSEVSLNPDRGVNFVALDYVVLNPPDASTNSTVRYLMEKELGYFRANELIALGQQYAGGYPEIFFEIFGMWLALPLMLLFGCAAALLLYLAMSSLLRGRVLTAFMAVYIYFGFNVGYIGGMLNFLLAPTFTAKFVVLVIVAIAERYFLRRELAAYSSRLFAEHAPEIPHYVRPARGG